MNFLDVLQSIHNKQKVDIEGLNVGTIIALQTVLIKNKKNADALSKLNKFFFFVDPIHYYYLLYFNIPYSYRVPFTFKISKKKAKKKDALLERIKQIFNWSDRDIEFNRELLELTVLKDKKYWKSELGINKG